VVRDSMPSFELTLEYLCGMYNAEYLIEAIIWKSKADLAVVGRGVLVDEGGNSRYRIMSVQS